MPEQVDMEIVFFLVAFALGYIAAGLNAKRARQAQDREAVSARLARYASQHR